MIIKKDDMSFYADRYGNPDVLLYAPQEYDHIYNYIVREKIKKIALCGGGTPTQEYLDTIKDFKWLEYMNGYMKGLDYSFINQLPSLKIYIGTIDFEIKNNSVEELYIRSTAKTRISNLCSNLKILNIEACKSIKKIFDNYTYPPKLKEMSFINAGFETCSDFFPNSSIINLSFSNCSKITSLNNLIKWEGLRQLKLENCRNLSDISVVGEICSLENLLIINCPKIDINKQKFSKKIDITIY